MTSALLEILRLRWRVLTIALALVLLNLGVSVYMGVYQASALIDAQTKWSDLRRRVAVAGQNDPAAIFRKGKADMDKLLTHIPQKSQFPRLLGGIFDTAASDSVTVGTVTYKPEPVKNMHLLSYGISLSVAGSYAAVKNFLADMQGMSEMVVIDSMHMTNSDPFEEKVVMDLHLTVFLQEAP
jgi:type IV pilus assembly protein PilO